MGKKFLLLFFGLLLNSFWSTSPTSVAAYSTCFHGKEPIITRFKGIHKNLLMTTDKSIVLDRYTDRQLGVFRISRSFKHASAYFTIASVSSRSSVIVMKCSDISTWCSAALIVPNPETTTGLLMRTIIPGDYNETRPKFGGFDDDWIPIVVTNSSEGRIKFTLCDVRESLEFRQHTVMPEQELAIPGDRCAEWRNVSDQWIVSCLGVHYAMTPVGEEIEAFIDYQRKQTDGRMKLIAMWVVGAGVLVGIFYMLVAKFVL